MIINNLRHISYVWTRNTMIVGMRGSYLVYSITVYLFFPNCVLETEFWHEMHFLGFWLIFQLLFVGASLKETTMTYIVFSKLSNSRIYIICIYIPKSTNLNIIMYHFFSISNSHSFFNSIQLSPRRDIDCALLFAPFFTCYCFSPLQQHKSTCIVDGDWYNNGGNDLS